MLSSALIFIALIIGAIALFCAYLYVSQERMVFYPRPNDAALREHWRWKRVEIPSGKHVLEAWWGEGEAPESNLTVLYFGGNAEDVLFTAANTPRIAMQRMLVVNYRGYGGTKGKPSQRALFEDALAVHDYVRGPGGAEARDIVVMGRSLGSGVATMLAAEREVLAAVLITPYDSIEAVASTHFPPLLVRTLLRHPFPSIDFAPRVRVPGLFLIAAHDEVIAPSHSHALARAWGGRTVIHTFPEAGHNDIHLQADYYERLNEFLRSLRSTDRML